MRFGLPISRIFLRLLCVLSLALVAFGHQPPALPRTGTLALSAHAFPDGSQPVLCVTDTAGKGGHSQAHGNGCDACRISSAFHLQAPECVALPERIGVASAFPLPSPPVIARAAYPPSAPPRAPPIPV
jgi:hypothetical protein